MAHYWSMLPAIGRFVISLGLAAIFAASLTCLDRTDRRWPRGGPPILGRFISEIFARALIVTIATPNLHDAFPGEVVIEGARGPLHCFGSLVARGRRTSQI